MMQQMPQAAEQEAPAQGGGASQLIKGIQGDMKKLGALLERAKPEAAEGLAAVIEAYEQFIEQLTSDAPAQPQAAPTGASTPEAGSNPNVRPV